MKELVIQSAADIKKLAGWKIEEASPVGGPEPRLILRISHPAAENQVILTIGAETVVGRQGAIITAESILTFRTNDFIKE